MCTEGFKKPWSSSFRCWQHKSLFWKYFFSLLLSIPRSSLVLHFSVGILVIVTLIWFKVDIKWRKKLEQNSYSLYLCTKKRKDISFWTKIISIFLLSSCPSQLQEFWAVQHQINASYISSITWVSPSLGFSQFPLSVCQSGLVGLVLGSPLSFPRTAAELLMDQIRCSEGEQEGTGN